MNINSGVQRYFNYQSWTFARYYVENGAVKSLKIDYDPILDVYLINARVVVRDESYPVYLELKRSGNFPAVSKGGIFLAAFKGGSFQAVSKEGALNSFIGDFF